MKIVKQTVIAKTRKLSAKWTVEATEDMISAFDARCAKLPPDERNITRTVLEPIIREIYRRYVNSKKPLTVEEELTQAMAQEITQEIDNEIINDLLKIVKENK
jgi:hypothetical protein